MPSPSTSALEDAYFDAVDRLDARRSAMTPEAIAAEEERVHQLGVRAFPGIALAHDDGRCNCAAHVEVRGGYAA